MKTIDTIVTFLHKASLRPALYAGIASLALTGKANAFEKCDTSIFIGFYQLCTPYDFNNDGKIDRQVYDTDGDGKPNYQLEFEYDAKGNRTKEIQEDANGKPKSVWAFEYDAKGNMTKKTFDSYADGRPDFISILVYDAEGNLTNEVHDYNADGKHEYVVRYVPGTHRIEEIDINHSRISDSSKITEERDFNGSITKIRLDYNEDGLAEYIWTLKEGWQEGGPSSTLD